MLKVRLAGGAPARSCEGRTGPSLHPPHPWPTLYSRDDSLQSIFNRSSHNLQNILDLSSSPFDWLRKNCKFFEKRREFKVSLFVFLKNAKSTSCGRGPRALLAQQFLVDLDFKAGVGGSEFLSECGGESVGFAKVRVIFADAQ